MNSSMLATRDRKADLHMRGVARLGEQMLGAPCDDLLAEVDEGLEEILERQDFRAGRRSGRSCCRRSSIAAR